MPLTRSATAPPSPATAATSYGAQPGLELGRTLDVKAGTTLDLGAHQGAFETLTLRETLAGTGDVTVSGLFAWTNGWLRGSGSLTATGGILIDGEHNLFMEGRTLNNARAAVWRNGCLFASNGR